jgi:hypothetical protein
MASLPSAPTLLCALCECKDGGAERKAPEDARCIHVDIIWDFTNVPIRYQIAVLAHNQSVRNIDEACVEVICEGGTELLSNVYLS